MPNRVLTGFTNNLGLKIVSVVVGVMMWLVVFGSRTVEITKEIPVQIITAPDVVIANEVPDKVVFRIAGPKTFLRGVLNRQEAPILVNLSNAKPGLVTYRFFSDNIHLPIGMTVASIHPTDILVKLEKVKVRRIPVKLEVQGVPKEGYQVVRTEVTPPTVEVRGPQSKVGNLTELPTNPIDVSGLRKTFETSIGFNRALLGVSVDGDLPVAKIQINPVSANFRIKNVAVKVQADFAVRVKPEWITVFVRADQVDLESLDQTLVMGTVDLRGQPH